METTIGIKIWVIIIIYDDHRHLDVPNRLHVQQGQQVC